MIAVYSEKAFRTPYLREFLGAAVALSPSLPSAEITAIAGWGLRPSTRKARRLAQKHALPYLSLEDGFLRSFGLGCLNVPPLSLIVDPVGVFYDATRPSTLENLLNEGKELTAELLHTADRARELVMRYSLCKYNQTEIAPDALFEKEKQNVLVVDQTAGDASIEYGLADNRSFERMLEAALDENPDAVIHIKVHPDVITGKKKGNLALRHRSSRIRVIADNYNPHSLVRHMDAVYVVTSQFGFEALLHGKRVVCFGIPFYAGWGATDDRISCSRRSAQRTMPEIFALAYCAYARYLNPSTGRAGSILDLIPHLVMQQERWKENSCETVCFGVQRWKRRFVRPFLEGGGGAVHFVRNAGQALHTCRTGGTRIITWGFRNTREAESLARRSGNTVCRMEDGFIRSLGLGSDVIAPYSLAIDTGGIYFDPSSESDLQRIFATFPFDDALRDRAARIREMIVQNDITKYNVDRIEPLDVRPDPGQTVIFVPGQVESDASIQFGAEDVVTNARLLEAVRMAQPDAFIIFKPHPDLVARNRPGGRLTTSLRRLCDHVEIRRSVLSCIAVADEVHTMTSLAGFDALLRGKRVVTYGRPFYAGWGLTSDRHACPERTRTLSLDELVAGALILYPRYYDHTLKLFVDCETVIQRIMQQRMIHGSEHEAINGMLALGLRQIRRWWRMLEGSVRG